MRRARYRRSARREDYSPKLMNFNEQMENLEDAVQEISADNSPSIDDFIRELEAKEKDLHISSDLEIEVEDSDFAESDLPDFMKQELGIEPVAPPPAAPAPSAAPAPATPAARTENAAEIEEQLRQMKRQVTKMEAERFELSETMRRRQTDFENFKKRVERERSESFVNQIGNLAKQMLPVLDNLNRALDFAGQDRHAKTPDFQQFFDGIVLVNQQLSEVLAEMGVMPIASVGEPFDPHYHEAVAVEPAAGVPANTITGELLRGYRLGDKVIRAAMVKVSTAAPAPARQSSRFADSDAADDILETD